MYKYFLECFTQHYTNFSGRARRKEYWSYVLFLWIFAVLVGLIASFLGTVAYLNGGNNTSSMFLMWAIIGIFSLAVLLPSLAVQVRRLHDTNRSGWWILLGLIPFVNYVGGIVLLVFYCLEGTPGPNKYGQDPKGGDPQQGYYYSEGQA